MSFGSDSLVSGITADRAVVRWIGRVLIVGALALPAGEMPLSAAQQSGMRSADGLMSPSAPMLYYAPCVSCLIAVAPAPVKARSAANGKDAASPTTYQLLGVLTHVQLTSRWDDASPAAVALHVLYGRWLSGSAMGEAKLSDAFRYHSP